MAVGHYQFEAIHPFEDGDGRTGRILNLLFLVEAGLLRQPVLSVYMLNLVAETSHSTTAKIRAMRELLDAATAYVRAKAPKI